MKRFLALILSLVMICTAGLAFADSLVVTPGAPTGCAFTLFQTYFDILTQSSGYTFNWDSSAVQEDGFDVYSATTEDGAMSIKVHCTDGKVSYVTGEGTIKTKMSDTNGARKFGEWFGVSMAGTCLGLYAGENGADALTQEVSTRFQTELTPMITVIQDGVSNPSKLKNGVAGQTVVLGYITGLEVSGDVDGSDIILTMKIAVTSPDGKVNIQ